jgi:hypothetical protein
MSGAVPLPPHYVSFTWTGDSFVFLRSFNCLAHTNRGGEGMQTFLNVIRDDECSASQCDRFMQDFLASYYVHSLSFVLFSFVRFEFL